MEKLLIIGVDTVVGAGLAQRLAGRFEIVGLHEQSSLEFEGCRTLRCDLSDAGTLSSQILSERPQWIVHCGPLSRSSWDLPAAGLSLNGQAEIGRALAQSAAEAGARLTVISTDAVFSAPRLFHGEEDRANAHHVAAAAARELEKAVEPAAALVVRTHAYGRSVVPGASFVDRALEELESQSPVTASPHCYATPIFAGDLADLLCAAHRLALSGIYHVAGAERSSQLRFARELASALNLAGQFSSPAAGTVDAIDVHEETSLSCRRAQKALNLPMPLLREGLIRLAEQESEKPGARPKSRPERPQPMKTAA